MVRLCFDYGHGGEDGGAYYNGRRESDDVLSIGKVVAEEVRRHGFTVDETRTSDITVSLEERSEFENRNTCDYRISFHRNAYKSELAIGVETFTYLNSGEKSKELAQRIQTWIVDLGFIDMGVKEADLYVLRETKAPAVLVEIGFIDNTGDNILFDSKIDEIIKALAKAILAQVGVGSYEVRENAENQVEKLKVAGFDATIIIFNN